MKNQPLIWRKGGWYFGQRKFGHPTAKALIEIGGAVQIGNFLITCYEDIGVIGLAGTGTVFDMMTADAQELLRRAVTSAEPVEVVSLVDSAAPYEICLGGFAIVVGFTIRPTEDGERIIMSRTWNVLTKAQRDYLAAVRDGTTAERVPARADTLGKLEDEGTIVLDMTKPIPHTITGYGRALLDRHGKK